jgi:hypothetical protein
MFPSEYFTFSSFCFLHLSLSFEVKKFWIDQFVCYKFWKKSAESEHSEYCLKILKILNIVWAESELS